MACLRMRRLDSIFFNPALHDFLLIFAVLNLVANLIDLSGLAALDLARASQVTAFGFVVALIYTAVFERNSSGS